MTTLEKAICVGIVLGVCLAVYSCVHLRRLADDFADDCKAVQLVQRMENGKTTTTIECEKQQ